MGKLLFSFFKRCLIVPLIMAIAAAIAISVVVPNLIEASQNSTLVSTPVVEPSNYEIHDYNRFNELKNGEFVGVVKCDELNINVAVCYNASSSDSVQLYKKSIEPWNNGSVAIIGDNLTRKFKPLHNARIGTELQIDYYNNAICSYKITDITYNNSIKNIPNALKENDLVLCVEYNDFESQNDGKLYIFYYAELGGVKQ